MFRYIGKCSLCADQISNSSTTETITVITTGTETITQTILTTEVIPTTVATVTVDAAHALDKRSLLPPPKCLGTTYLASRITSACSCIGVPAVTVSATFTVSTDTVTFTSEYDSTATVDVTATEIDTITIYSSVTTTETTTSTTTETETASATATAVCPPPQPDEVISNAGFECGGLGAWSTPEEGLAEVISPGINSNFMLHTQSADMTAISQTLNTVSGQAYWVDFDVNVVENDSVSDLPWYWYVSSDDYDVGFADNAGSMHVRGGFIADSERDHIFIQYGGNADFYFDNFVLTPFDINNPEK
ncbi:hypothetical protein F5884DRAFT_788962 [Xylogone sp. PMI_703]|nr:hypothetical protein F5884DRAFT_788962 [Xylogone sp. PMI_703]